MKINKKSWHYWLNDVTDSKLCYELRYGNVGLCDYFWGTIKSLLKAICTVVGCLMLGGAILGIVLAILHAIVFLITGALGYPLSWVSLDWAMVVVVVSMLLTLLGGFSAWVQDEINFLPEYVKIKIEPSLIKDKEPSLLKSYYSAWKDKVCPLVELED